MQRTNALVVDFGSYQCRAGWASYLNAPQVVVRSLAWRVRGGGPDYPDWFVGDSPPPLEASKFAPVKTPFDGGIPCRLDAVEAILDFVFSQLGVSGSSLGCPLVITEPVACPPVARRQVSELLFEGYGAAHVSFTHDALCNYWYNRYGQPDGLIVSSGHSATHIIPMLGSQPVFASTKRLSQGGASSTNHYLRVLQTKYPMLRPVLSLSLAESLKREHTRVALDYNVEMQCIHQAIDAIKADAAATNPLVHMRRLCAPSQPTVTTSRAPDPEVHKRRVERGRALAMLQQQRRLASLRDRIGELSDRVEALRPDEDELPSAEYQRVRSELREAQRAARTLERKLDPDRAQSPLPPEVEKGTLDEEELAEKYPLINIPDDQLTPDEKAQKRKQKMAFGRERAKIQRQKEKAHQEEQQRDPKWLEEQRLLAAQYAERINGRKRTRNALSQRKSGATRRRARMIAIASADYENDDDFGLDDNDWDVYREMAGVDESEDEEDRKKLIAIESAIKRVDSNYISALDTQRAPSPLTNGDVEGDNENSETSSSAAAWTPLGGADGQLSVDVEQIRIPELLFQPNLMGLDQGGLVQAIANALVPFTPEQQARMTSNILLVGGNVLYPGLQERLLQEVTAIRPVGERIGVALARDPIYDAWRGAAHQALTALGAVQGHCHLGWVTRRAYEEQGARLFHPP